MELTNAKYLEEHGGGTAAIMVDIDGESWLIPCDPENDTYNEIVRQESEGIISIEGWA
jgi:hypothetical protein